MEDLQDIFITDIRDADFYTIKNIKKYINNFNVVVLFEALGMYKKYDCFKYMVKIHRVNYEFLLLAKDLDFIYKCAIYLLKKEIYPCYNHATERTEIITFCFNNMNYFDWKKIKKIRKLLPLDNPILQRNHDSYTKYTCCCECEIINKNYFDKIKIHINKERKKYNIKKYLKQHFCNDLVGYIQLYC